MITGSDRRYWPHRGERLGSVRAAVTPREDPVGAWTCWTETEQVTQSLDLPRSGCGRSRDEERRAVPRLKGNRSWSAAV